MFQRLIRLIILPVLVLLSGAGVIAQQCPDTYPKITGPDVVGASINPVQYTTPLIPGHNYSWVVTELPGGNVVGTSSTNVLTQVWNTPGDYQIALTEGIAGNSCTPVTVTPPMSVLVKPMLTAYFYYEFHQSSCYLNKITCTATGDGRYPPLDPGITYEWKWRVYNPQGPWQTAGIIPPTGTIVDIEFPATSGITYEVNLKVSKTILGRLWEDEITDFIYVDPDKFKPVVLLATPTTPSCLYQEFNFSAEGSQPTFMATSEFFKYIDWDFGDGTTLHLETQTGVPPLPLTAAHTYTAPANGLTVTVTMTNSINCVVSQSIVIDVPNTIPVASFTFAQTCVDEPAPFTDLSLPSTGMITDWWWSWGDGSPVDYYNLANPPPNPVTHVFTDLLPHQVTLKVRNTNGCEHTTIPVTVLAQPSPKADFTYPTVVCEGDIVQFNSDLSSPLTGTPIVLYEWDFGDPSSPGNITTGTNPTHQFSGAGSYIVTLTVTNQAGCANTKTLPVSAPLVVSPHPDIDFVSVQGSGAYDQIFTAVINPLQNVNNNIYWEFGDGTGGFGSPITHTYPGPGNYIATCTGIDMVTGCSAVAEHPVMLGAPPAACFTANPPNQCQNAPVLFVPCPPGGPISTEFWDFGDGNTANFVPPNVPASPNHSYAAPGSYQVTRILNQGTPQEASFFLWVTVFDAPTANFTWFSDPQFLHQGQACSGETVYFTDQSYANSTPPGTIYQWYWDFGDPLSGPNNFSTVANPVHTFTTVANGGQSSYNVTLRVRENQQDCESPPTTIVVTINPPVPVDYTVPTFACVGTAITFQSTGMDPLTIANWTWNFGDGTPVSNDPISTQHAYMASSVGLRTTTLTVVDVNGCTNSISRNINVIPSPTAGFTYSSPSCEGDLISFTDQSLPGGPPGDHIVQWEWFWGDGTMPDPQVIPFGSNPNVQHQFPVILGTYTWPVRLRVTNTYGCIHEVLINVNLLPAPVASFATVLGTYQCAGQAVQFQSLSDPNGGGPIVQWLWNFGDPPPNNTSNAENPTHTYATAGTYTVTLQVRTANNCLSTVFSQDVVVNELPVANFTSTTVCEGDPTVFTDISTPNATGTLTYLWDFGGGVTSIAPSPTYVFPTAGLRPVTLTITNSNGCAHQVIKQVMVNPKAVPMFSFTNPSCQNSTITFTSNSFIPPTQGSAASITSWEWDFGDGTPPGSGPLVVHPYTDNLTSHLVTLTVTTSDGCVSTLQQFINHNAVPTANFSNTGALCEQQTVSFFDNSSTAGGIGMFSWLWNFNDPGSGVNNTSTQPNPTHTFTTAGTFNVSLTVTDVNGCTSAPQIIPVTILAKPVAAFTGTNTCLGTGTVFTDLSEPAGNIATWLWQYDDGLQDNTQNPTHFFATAGVHSVTLTVTTNDGCFKSLTKQVEVYPKPLVTFTSTAPVCAGNAVTFTDFSTTAHGFIVMRTWDFGDGLPEPPTPNPTITHTYTTGGTYNVTLTILTSDGCEESRTIPVQIQFSPVASFFNSNVLCPGTAVQFNSNPSSPNGGSPITAWLWNFGDLPSGSSNTSTAPNPSHVFTTPGTYIITLTVTNVDNCSNTITQTITISPAPTALFTASQACQGQPTTFDGSASNTAGAPDIISYAWNFGDFQTGTGQIVNHTYANYGYYNATLTISNTNGCTAVASQTVFVQPQPVALFTFSQVNCSNAEVSFFDQSFIPAGFLGAITEWKWEYGDGNQDIFDPVTVPVVVTHTYSDGLPVHTVKLTVTTEYGCESFMTQDVTSIPAPIAHITVAPTTCINQPIQFNAGTSSPNGGTAIQAYSWNFGDGGTSNLPNPQYTYVTGGDKTVTLTVTNASGCLSTPPDTKVVTVNAKPTADFTTEANCQGGETTFTNASTAPGGATITTYFWDFGDSQTMTAPPPVTHIYASAGVYQVKLVVTTDQGCFKDTTKAVEVYGKPNAAFTATGNSCAGDSISFSATASTTPHGYIVEYSWDFDDGTPIQITTTPLVKHQFANGGTYNVKLIITTSDDCTAEKINPVTVHERPLANFSYPGVICAKTSIQFTDISQGGGSAALTAWLWNFGDPGSGANNTSAAQNPVHIFSTGGNDTVKLIVTNGFGCTDTTFNVVTVNDAPVAQFSAETSCMAAPTQFTDESTTPTPGTVNAWLWTFGDPSSGTNNTSTLQNPTHVYNSSGIYTVTLQVTNSTQCTKDTTIQVEVSPRPTAMFEYSAACVGDSTQFTDLSLAPGNQIESWLWDFGCLTGTCTSTIQNPKYAYASPGTYSVKLTVTNFAGCSDSITIAVVARAKPTADFTSVAYFCPAGKVDFQDISTGSASAIASRLWTFEPGYTSTSPNPSYTFPVTNMNYAVSLMVTDTYGCQDTIVDSVFVKPGFAFTFTYDSVCQGFATQFTPVNNTPGDTLYSVTWNFGDPSSGPANNSQLYSPTHTFTGPGTYVVRMKAFNSDNCVDSIYREVTVYQAPVPLFGYTSVPCNDTIYFRDSTLVAGSGGIASWLWDFGDPVSGPDNTSSFANPLHVYSAEGFYTVKLVITNNRGCVDSIIRTVQKFPCIQAGFDVNDTLCARYSIAFTETSTPVSRINSWTWSWGDGTPDTTYTTYGSPIYHTYSTAGTYPVMLTITSLVNGTTITDNLMGSVTIRPTPLAYFANVPVCLNQFTLFRDTSQVFEENITSWNWNFGNGPVGTSILRNPPYRYDSAGIYDVKLVVSNKFGCADSLTKPTRVYGLPEAHFESSSACSGDPTFFTDKSLKSDTTLSVWRWSFGDPATLRDSSVLQNPSYVYPDPQEYTIRMIVKDLYGCMDTVDSIVKVNVTPLSAFTVINGYNNKQGQVKMNNVSTGAESYQWEFGNGKYSSEENPVALFTEDGTYTIKLISLNQFDCSDTTYYQYELLFKGLYVPNAFSPSGASLGERLFQPKGINLIQYHVSVFDIWGHLMWESTELDEHGSPKEGWDGTHLGTLMPQGNYMWKISAVFVDNSQWEGSDIGVGTSTKTMGTVTLIR